MKFLSVILSMSLIISALVAIGFGTGNGPGSRQQVIWNFCTGTTENFREVEHNYSLLTGTALPESELISKIVVAISLAAVLAELICYMIFFQHLNGHDKAMLKKKVLKMDQVKRRKRQNAITFLGQFYGFIVEVLLYTGLIYALLHLSISHRVWIVLGVVIEFGIISVVEVLTSNNLIEYLPHKTLYH